MNRGGRRSPLGPLFGGLTCCVLLVAVLSLTLGAGSLHSPADAAKITTVSHAVASAHLVARPATPDQHATPAVAVVLAVGLGVALVRHRRVTEIRVRSGRRPSGRAPPGPITKP